MSNETKTNTLTHLFVFDYELGRVFRYFIAPSLNAEDVWDKFCAEGRHSEKNCEWMSTAEGTVTAENIPADYLATKPNYWFCPIHGYFEEETGKDCPICAQPMFKR